MDQFKLKKLKITKTEKIVLTLLTLAISFIYFIVPVDLSDKKVLNEVKDVKAIINNFNFPGEMKTKNVFNEEYANIVYLNDGNLDSHFVNLETETEISVLDFIKDDQEIFFYEKLKELLLLKYPSKIVDILISEAKQTFIFEQYYLTIYYDVTNLLNTKREFNIKVYYNEISEFLEFKPEISNNSQREDGFVYDPNKISVSFTFDDGPNGKKTQTLIDVLEDYKMSATFFMVANKLENDVATVKKVYDSHSEVGYHSYRHEYFTRQSSEKIKEEFAKSDAMLYQITGGHFKLTRPPYGAYNKTTLESIDNAFIRWNLDTNDWQYKDVEYIKKYVLDNISNNSIILFHDTYKTSIEAAISLIETLYLMDVQVLSVTELANLRNIELLSHEVYYDFK